MNVDLLNWACTLNAPLWCMLLHRARATPLRRSVLRSLGLCLPILWALLIGWHAGSLALGLVLPLAALSLIGAVYTACISVWPRATRSMVGLTSIGTVVLLMVA